MMYKKKNVIDTQRKAANPLQMIVTILCLNSALYLKKEKKMKQLQKAAMKLYTFPFPIIV